MGAGGNKWPTGLCDCFSDCGTCCCGFWCGPCLFGENSSDLGDGSCCLNCCLYYVLSLFCLQCCLAGPKRGKLRTNHGLEETPCGDCCTHCWCGACAICQEARVIKWYGAVPTGPGYTGGPPPMQAPGQQFMASHV